MNESQKTSGWTRARVQVALGALTLLGGLAVWAGQELRIVQFGLEDARPQLRHSSETHSYYILYRGREVTGITLAVDAALGQEPEGRLGDPARLGPNASAFYRVA